MKEINIQMDPSVTNRGVPDVIPEKHVKPELPKEVQEKFKFKKVFLNDMFDLIGSTDYSLVAVNLYNDGYKINDAVEVAYLKYKSVKWHVARTAKHVYTVVTDPAGFGKVYKEKR